jgi:anthranilate phosphoribosyltransferase
VESIADGVQAAREAIRDGRATTALDGYVAASLRHAPAEAGS